MANDRPDKVVQITLNESGIPVPDQDPVEVWRSNQKVKWVAEFEFRITVQGYDDIHYSHGGGGSSDYICKTGYFGDDAASSYKYTISANGVDNDPVLDIKP